jgi:hypothetical protein
MSSEVSSEVSINEQRVREYAYHIWLTEGCPQGQAPRHWAMARQLAEAESMAGSAAPPSARPRPASRARSATTTVKAAANKAPPVKKPRKNGKADI